MNWIVIAILATAIVSLTGLALWFAKKEDDELADIKNRLNELEKNKKED